MPDNLTPQDRRKAMRAVKSKGTSLERRLFAMLAGMRLSGWKKNATDMLGKPDVVFPEARVVIFANGCFWHGCAHCNRPLPETNREYWEQKIQRNTERDGANREALTAQGWTAITVWEHEMRDPKARRELQSEIRLALGASTAKATENLIVTTKQKALEEYGRWYDLLPVYSVSGGPAKGTIAGGLVLLEDLRNEFDLDINAHTAKGGSQVSGASGTAVKKLLARYGETRRYVAEGGRTNRGLRGDMISMLHAIGNMELDILPSVERNEILEELQKFLVDKVGDFHDRQRLKVVFDPSSSAWQSVYDLLEAAKEKGKEGAVAEYLVGAKLQLRFPEIEVRNESFSTADEQSNLPGDFLIGDTAFHVTVAPMLPLFDKCKRNLEQGYRVYLLTREGAVYPTRLGTTEADLGQITVSSIESFVAQNIEELSSFSQDRIAHGFYRLLETYNRRTDSVEIDKSTLFEIPENLLRCSSKLEE